MELELAILEILAVNNLLLHYSYMELELCEIAVKDSGYNLITLFLYGIGAHKPNKINAYRR